MKVLIIGAGGHGEVVADILFKMWTRGLDIELEGFLDDDENLLGKRIMGLRVLGPVSAVNDIAHDAVIVAVGDNATRKQFFDTLHEAGETFVTAIHPSAILAPDVVVEDGAMICAGAVVNPGAVIRANTILNTSATVDHHNVIGPHAHVAPGVNLGGEVRVEEGALVGIGSTVMPRIAVGAWSVVGAGAAVTKNIPKNEIWLGVPARPYRK